MAKETGTEEFRALIRDLGKMDSDLRKELRPMLQEKGRGALQAVQAKASWSRKIPGATRLTVSFSGKRGGLAIKTSRLKAPHARAYENQGRPGTIRHPVFGNRAVWVTGSARPFQEPGARPLIDGIDEDIGHVVDEVSRRFDFK